MSGESQLSMRSRHDLHCVAGGGSTANANESEVDRLFGAAEQAGGGVLFDRHSWNPQFLGMNVMLSPESEQYIREKVDSGDYPSPGFVIDEGLRLLQEKDKLKQEVREEIADGLADIKEGRIVSSDEAERTLAGRKEKWKANRAA